MESGNNGVGPTTWNSRPVRAAASRHFNYAPHHSGNLTRPVRRWQKRWVLVSPPPPNSSSKKPTTTTTISAVTRSKAPSKSPILLCKWTPLSPSSTADGQAPRRKFRYTPIAVAKEQKKVTAKRVADEDFGEKTRVSDERPAMDNADNYGMLDMNSDLAESPPQASNKGRPLTLYLRRS